VTFSASVEEQVGIGADRKGNVVFSRKIAMREFFPIDDDFLFTEIPIILTIKCICNGAWDMLVSMAVK
jgi:hypothetical protein